MLNKCVIMGRLTADPELRYTRNNTAVTSFTVAVERDYSQDSEKVTDFVPCVAWRSTGEFVEKYFHKGSMIVVSGRLQSRRWKDRDDNNRTSWEILADSCYFGESKRDNDSGSYGQQSGSYQRQASQGGGYQQYRSPERATDVSAQDFRELDDSDGELPF